MSKRSDADWPNFTASLSLALIGGLVGDRAYELIHIYVDRLARLANGMEPLPLTFVNGLSMARRFPADWWVVMLVSACAGIAVGFLKSRERSASIASFIKLLSVVFLLRYVSEGHLPIHEYSFRAYGLAHYLIYQLGFLIENAMLVGGGWLAALCGWLFMEHREDRLFEVKR